MRYSKHWMGLTLGILVGAFLVLGYFGREVFQQVPPIPKHVVTRDGRVLFTGNDILEGQRVWQSMGGQEVGSIWGHGAYAAPDWTADWLHRQADWLLEHWAEAEHATAYTRLGAEAQAALRARLHELLHVNTYNPATRDLTIAPVLAEAAEAVGEHYAALFGDNPAFARLRQAYALPERTITSSDKQASLNAFFFWAAWACVANRPGAQVSYTQNWPPDELAGNHPPGTLLFWSMVSVVLLLTGIAVLIFYYAVVHIRHQGETPPAGAEREPLLTMAPTASMRATRKFFRTVAVLFALQVLLGMLTAFYGAKGTAFYALLSDWLPYAVVRTWHLQLGLFWIMAAWLAAGLFLAPAVAGREPRGQRLGVNLLHGGFCAVVAGSLAGQWWGVQHPLGQVTNFWFGHQGLEFIDLGRFWQLVLLGVLAGWFWLVLRGMWPGFARGSQERHMLMLLMISAGAIALCYGGALMWRRGTSLGRIEAWREWVERFWIEGFFQLFVTVVVTFLLTRMRLLSASSATVAVRFTLTLFLAGGAAGTFHHFLSGGTPVSIQALEAALGALAVVPLAMIVLEGYENMTLGRGLAWVRAYRWPVACLIALACWAVAGPGLIGFLLGTPLALYYTQGLATEPVHSHTTLFGVYGMLGIGLMLFCLRRLSGRQGWRTRGVAFAFWAINAGLGLTLLLSVLPVGLLQTWASVEYGTWFARSAEFMHNGLLETLRWLRVTGDTLFAAGVLALAWFVLGLKTGWSLSGRGEDAAPPPAAPEPSYMGYLKGRKE